MSVSKVVSADTLLVLAHPASTARVVDAARQAATACGLRRRSGASARCSSARCRSAIRRKPSLATAAPRRRADAVDEADRLVGEERARPPSWPSTAKPRGLSRSEAILARNLLRDSPIETVMPSSRSTSRGEPRQHLGGAHAVQALGAGRDRETPRRSTAARPAASGRASRSRTCAADRGRISPCSADDGGVRAQRQRLEHRHRRAHAEGARDVAGGRDHAALAAADDHRLVGERRVVALLDRGVEGVAIDMGDGRAYRSSAMAEQARRAAGRAARAPPPASSARQSRQKRGAPGVSRPRRRRARHGRARSVGRSSAWQAPPRLVVGVELPRPPAKAVRSGRRAQRGMAEHADAGTAGRTAAGRSVSAADAGLRPGSASSRSGWRVAELKRSAPESATYLQPVLPRALSAGLGIGNVCLSVSLCVSILEVHHARVTARSWRTPMRIVRGCRAFAYRGIGAGMAKTVLIVEDNELNMKLFHDLLEAHGYETIGTRNGIEALDLARKHRPDLILMDIQLPEVSGLEVTKWLKDDPELKRDPGGRGHRLRDEGRRGAHPRGRLRGLSVEADLGRQVHRDHPAASSACVRRSSRDRARSRRRRHSGQRQAARSAAVGGVFRRRSPPSAARRRWRSASAPNATSSCST